MSKFYGFCLFLCGVIHLSLSLPFAEALYQRDPILAILFFGMGVSWFIGGALLLFLPRKVE
ncbi:MAG: hypothetical protein Q7K16_01315 [Candidatus Azambacteria bacterium]|nr:hypothetical protein [Candidatus Azambacteria bacterium]